LAINLKGNEENRLYFFRAIERFLAKHLGGRVEESDEKIPELEEKAEG
jgi:hypothetical protein